MRAVELFRDPAEPDRFVETYMVESWGDHLRQHDRVSVEQQDDEKELRPLLTPGTAPIVTHLIAARPAILADQPEGGSPPPPPPPPPPPRPAQ